MGSVRTSSMIRVAAAALSLAVVAEMALSAGTGPALAQSGIAAPTMAATMAMATTTAPTMAATMAGTPSAPPAAYNGTCPSGSSFNLYAAIGYDSDISKIFEQKTGIHVNLVDDSTGNILAKISAEGINPQWDVTWFDGDAAMQALDDQGFLVRNGPGRDGSLIGPVFQKILGRGLIQAMIGD